MLSRRDGRPALKLGRGRRAERRTKPLGNRRQELRQHVADHCAALWNTSSLMELYQVKVNRHDAATGRQKALSPDDSQAFRLWARWSAKTDAQRQLPFRQVAQRLQRPWRRHDAVGPFLRKFAQLLRLADAARMLVVLRRIGQAEKDWVPDMSRIEKPFERQDRLVVPCAVTDKYHRTTGFRVKPRDNSFQGL